MLIRPFREALPLKIDILTGAANVRIKRQIKGAAIVWGSEEHR
jgi:hypothetical protein